jgi:hypothetical protein
MTIKEFSAAVGVDISTVYRRQRTCTALGLPVPMWKKGPAYRDAQTGDFGEWESWWYGLDRAYASVSTYRRQELLSAWVVELLDAEQKIPSIPVLRRLYGVKAAEARVAVARAEQIKNSGATRSGGSGD